MALMRQFESGATRNLDANKLDFEGFLSPSVMRRFAEYMHANRVQADGVLRDSDNWQKGIPPTAYMKSGFRHFFAWWAFHRGEPAGEDVEDSLCALIFNAQGYLHELLKARAQVERECYEPDEIVETLAHAVEAPMPPFVEAMLADAESDEPGSLKAGEAFREHGE